MEIIITGDGKYFEMETMRSHGFDGLGRNKITIRPTKKLQEIIDYIEKQMPKENDHEKL